MHIHKFMLIRLLVWISVHTVRDNTNSERSMENVTISRLMQYLLFKRLNVLLILIQINEEASDKVLEVEKQFNKVRRPIFNKRSEAISKIPEFWITVVSG